MSWWRSRGLVSRLTPVLGVLAYWLVLWRFAGEIKVDHVAFGAVILILAHGGPLGTRILGFLLPFVLTGMAYDSQRYWGDAVRGEPNIAEPYLLEKKLFGVNGPDGRVTLNEWFGDHLHPALDFVSGAAYLTFIAIFMAVSGYLIRRVYGSVGVDWSARRRRGMAQALVWSFFIVNVMGYITYFIYPAAPPWYVERFGLDTVVLDVGADPARTLRFDALFGTSFFTHMYGYESNAFGAIPSLHISYGVVSAYFAFHLGTARLFTVLFVLLMSFSAVYLNHHYVIDVVIGALYGVAAALIALRFLVPRCEPVTAT